ncbi:hypothetical protein Vretifemale_868 [Volvox reticuliferus]|uniref:Uncharacterized protein n=1 Tax=Volvox reticuliferus TaxID=1737510 RepID=A0A8J4C2B7_9CHLO|nr:hypothetical protein Vretifemale_868 [Volvox reticuliferus]
MQLANGAGGGAGTSVASGSAAGKGGGGGMGATGVSPDSLRDMLAQSALHHQKYKQIREDYNRLLNKWVPPHGSEKQGAPAPDGGYLRRCGVVMRWRGTGSGPLSARAQKCGNRTQVFASFVTEKNYLRKFVEDLRIPPGPSRHAQRSATI